jgi:XTP/dITP diphosphohydrolase
VARRFREPRLLVASHNRGKLREFAELLAPHGVEVLSAADLSLPEPEETGTTFAENAALKARAAAEAAGLPALADDSGLSVTALDGAPGIHSARWAGPEKDFGRAMRRVEESLAARGVDPAGAEAAFVCVLCLCWPDGHAESFEAPVAGTLVFPPRGSGGFGYDRIFRPVGHGLTFGEMAPETKHALSHRARALDALIAACFRD